MRSSEASCESGVPRGMRRTSQANSDPTFQERSSSAHVCVRARAEASGGGGIWRGSRGGFQGG